jgi:signal transduction histidine kinase
MRWNIRNQLFVPLCTLLLGVIGISTWTGLASARRAREQIDGQVQNVVRTLRESDFPLTRHVLEQMKGLSGAEYVLTTSDGHQTSTLTPASVSLPHIPAGTADDRGFHLGPAVEIDGESYLGSVVQLTPTRAGAGTLYILYPYALWQDALWEAIRPSLVLGVFAGVASLFLTVGVARRLNRRIGDLERGTRAIAAGDFQPLPLTGGRDEIRDLGQSINDMAERLDQLQKTVRDTERLRLLGQVSGGLAHQLRNGVTGARLAVQLHADECHSLGEPEALAVALHQLDLVEANLKRFLDLGRPEQPRREACSLTDLISDAVKLLTPQSRHAHIDLEWQAPAQQLCIHGDRARLGHLFLNVIGNAVEAAGPGGWVRITARNGSVDTEHRAPSATAGAEHPTHAWAAVEVTDSGAGPPADVASRLFEPFVTNKRDGVGLGLAVARQVAEAHGGNIHWERVDGHTCFRIELPVRSRGES